MIWALIGAVSGMLGFAAGIFILPWLAPKATTWLGEHRRRGLILVLAALCISLFVLCLLFGIDTSGWMISASVTLFVTGALIAVLVNDVD